MFWLNVNYPTGIWKLHTGSCRYCKPVETLVKGVNEIKENGAWISFESPVKARIYFEKNSKNDSIWQPCKACKPE
jgi:hypothetical protein